MNRSAHGAVVARLHSAGWELPAPPSALAAYSPAVTIPGLAFTSGQLPVVDGELPATGRVGSAVGSVSPEQAKALAAQSALNALAALVPQIGDLGRISRVIKVTGFVASEPDFFGQSAVIDGASELLHTAFGEAGVHARSAVGVASLPKDSPVEVELIVELDAFGVTQDPIHPQPATEATITQERKER